MTSVSRRTALVRILAAAATAPLGLAAFTTPAAPTFAQEVAEPGETAEPVASDASQEAPAVLAPAAAGPLSTEPGYAFWSLSDAANGPVQPGRTRNDYGREIGFATYDNGAFIHHHHYNDGLRGAEWMSSRIGEFSILDGALMVEARGLLNDSGCFSLEMRHQAYKDRRYIRSNWLVLDPPSGSVILQTDGIWTDMVKISHSVVPDLMRPLWEWNRFLFIASGFHFEGWLNGAKVVEGYNERFGRGRVALVTMRMNKAVLRTEFRNLHVWDGIVPDPTTVWS